MPPVGKRLFYLWGEMLRLLFSGGVTEDVTWCRYQVLPRPTTSASATPTVVRDADQPTSLFSPLVLLFLALLTPYPPTHTSDTTNTSHLLPICD